MTHWTEQIHTGSEWHVYSGDALQVLRNLPDNSFHCVVTSPPYFWLRDYGVENQIGQEETLDEYIHAIVCIMDEIYRVLRRDGVLFLNIGDTYYSGKGQSQGVDRKSNKRRFGLRAVDESGGLGLGLQRKSMIGIPWRVAIEMSQRRWALRSAIIWNRQHSLPESVGDRPRRNYEHIFQFTKSSRYYFNREALVAIGEEDIWTISAKPKSTKGIKTAPYPDELVKRCLDIGCPPKGKVLDPFAGSGTTLRVALQSGRDATGIDLNQDFCDYIVKMLGNLKLENSNGKLEKKKTRVKKEKCQMSLKSI
jgi:DNA modification methylase